VAAVALTEDGHAGKAYTLTGPEVLTPRDKTRILGEANGRELAFEELTRSDAEAVAVEDPGYPPARELFRSMGAEVVGVSVDGDGLRVDALPDDAKIVYITPSHQFPLGTPDDAGAAAGTARLVRHRDAVVIEDDYDTEFRYGGRPIEPLQSLDDTGRVLYVGTFSKE
jgi:DNA-binding transcriptional MocR family regulator